jgi:hypothetical protein
MITNLLLSFRDHLNALFMRKNFSPVLGLLALLGATVLPAQTFTTNRSPVGLEHNLLFFAPAHLTVTQTGSAQLDLTTLFDGRFEPVYSSTAPTPSDPTVILIENLPNYHIQAGAWIGWSTRYWPASNFKIEGYDIYAGANVWRTIADYSASAYSADSFTTSLPSGSFEKIKFTFYSAHGDNGRLGVSELFFIHPEATAPYESLTGWKRHTAGTHFLNGNVGIGTTNPTHKLAVNGTIKAKEVIVETTGWSDYVFADDYALAPLSEVETHIKTNKHLPGIPSAAQISEQGISVGDMQAKLLAKIEELTLHQIAQEKRLSDQSREISGLKDQLSKLIDPR